MALKFGQAASDYTPSENPDEVWILRFKEPMTQIRIAPAVREDERGKTVYGAEAWSMEREHYAEGIRSFPCAARFKVPCVGCDDPDEDVQQRSRAYYINALDEKAELRVYKMGVKLYKIFLGRQQRALSNDPSNKQPLSDRDYIIIKSGQKLETSYDPEPGEKYPVEFPDQLHDIDQILSDRYEAALAWYNGESATKSEAAPEKTARIGQAKAKDEPQGDPWAKPEEKGKTVIGKKDAAAAEWQAWGQAPTNEQIDSADTPSIKAWLDSREIEYPSRAPRVRLLEMAKDAAEPPF